MLIEEKIIAILGPRLLEQGYEIAQAHFKSGKNACLQVVVDRVEPISLEEIVKVSETISSLLDETDPIDEPYTLDVSSLGAEKPIALERLGEYAGRYVNLHLSHPYKGENIVEGTLLSIQEGMVELQVQIKSKKKSITFPVGDVDKARLAIEF